MRRNPFMLSHRTGWSNTALRYLLAACVLIALTALATLALRQREPGKTTPPVAPLAQAAIWQVRHAGPQPANAPDRQIARARSATVQPPRQAIVLLDRALAAMADGLARSGQRVMIVGGPDALRDAARRLPARSRFSAIHIVSHGAPGSFSLDGARLDATTLQQGDGAGLVELARHLAPGGDILVYGCQSASGQEGRKLLRAIADRTGANVAGSDQVTGVGAWSLAQQIGKVTARPIRLPTAVRLWTNELYEGGWFGDTNVPAGAVAPHPKAGQTGSGRLSSMGDNTGGPGVTFSVQMLACCSAQAIGNAATSSYAAAATANDYFYSNIVLGGSNGAAITKFQYNQVPNNAAGAQFELALYDTVTATLTPISGAITVSGSATSLQLTTTPVSMVAGRTYQLRFYGFNCGGGATCYIDNPQIWTKANQAPGAINDSFATGYMTTVTGNVVSNDSDPESQSLSVSTINSGSYTVGVPIALAGGTLTMTSASGAFSFTPASGFYGSQSFSYGLSDGFGGTASATATINVNQADLSLSKTVANGFVWQGAAQSYTLTVTNSPSSTVTATGITVRDTLPAGFSFTSAAGTGSYSSATGVWTVGSLAPGASANLTINGTVTAAIRSIVTNSAEIAASSIVDPDSTPNNGSNGEDDYAAASFTVIDPSLAVTKSSQVLSDGIDTSNYKAIPGASVRYCVLITNTGNTTATNIVANDSLPGQVSYVSGSARTGPSCASASSTGGLSISGNTITASSNSLAPAQTFAVTYDVTIG